MATFNLRTDIDVQSRRDMETRFQSQIEGVLVAVEELVSYNLHHPTIEASDAIQARSL